MPQKVEMGKLNRPLAVVSLLIGMALVVFALLQSGLSPTIGIALGALLMLNGIVRFWLARAIRGQTGK